MTYRNIAPTEVDPDSPTTATLMQALAENHLAVVQLEPTAIDEGKVNGAQFYQHALVTTPGDTDALIYDHAVDGTVAAVVFNLGADKLTGFEYEAVVDGFSHNSGSDQNIRVRFFRETDVAFTTFINLASLARDSSSPLYGRFRFSLNTASDRVLGAAGLGITDAANDPRDQNWDLTNPQNVTSMELSFTGGSIDAGKLHIYKRATYVGRE